MNLEPKPGSALDIFSSLMGCAGTLLFLFIVIPVCLFKCSAG